MKVIRRGKVVKRTKLQSRAIRAPKKVLRLPRVRSVRTVKPAAGHGRHYLPGAPVRTRTGAGFTVLGKVVCARSGRPIGNATVEFWHAGHFGSECRYSWTASGPYRATLYADQNGGFTYNTDRPCIYEGQAPHIHVKVSAPRTHRSKTFTLVVKPNHRAARPTFRLQPNG